MDEGYRQPASGGRPADRADTVPAVPRSVRPALLIVVVGLGAALRLVGLGHPPTLFPDEAYSANVAALPVGEIVAYVRATDPHPPLWYLVLAPVERMSRSEAALRSPSALAGTGALAVLALWQRRRGWEGLAATALWAASPFAVFFARQARMYGLLELLGVSAAAAAERWWATGRRGWLGAAGAAAVAASFTHALGFLVLGGLGALAGLRRDRAAWETRAVATGGLALYALTWLRTTLGLRDASLYERVTLDSFLVTVNEMVAPVPANRYVVVALIVAGGIALVRRGGTDGRVWAAAFALPLLAAAAASVRVPVFIPKSVVVLGWGVPLALAALAGAVADRLPERLRPAGAGLAFALVALVATTPLPGTFDQYERTDLIVGRVRQVAGPGDLVVGHPVEHVVRWYFVTRPLGPTVASPWPGSQAVAVGDGPRSGRAWVVDALYGEPPLDLTGPACAAPETLNDRWLLRCTELVA
jgi:mannosyltransferase